MPAATALTVLPAVDVEKGRLVRAVSGAGGEVVSFTQSLADQGAQWLHVADLDAARGVGSNAELLTRVVRSVTIPVQWSGGVRTAAQVQQALDAGASRVNLAAETLADRAGLAQMLARFEGRVSVAVDVVAEQVCPRAGSGRPVAQLQEALQWLVAQRCATVVVTDVQADGALTGVNTALMRRVGAQVRGSGLVVIASGGVASVEELRALRELSEFGVQAVVVGSALLTGRFTMSEALAAVGS